MRDKLKTGVFVVAVISFLGTAADFGYRRVVVRLGIFQPAIECHDTTRELGELERGETAACEFVVRNRGSRELAIGKVQPGCGACIEVVKVPETPIGPGRSGVIRVNLLTEHLKGDVVKTLVVQSNDPRQPWLALKIKARVKALDSSTADSGKPGFRTWRESEME